MMRRGVSVVLSAAAAAALVQPRSARLPARHVFMSAAEPTITPITGNVLVVGGTGGLGTAMTKNLVDRGLNVYATVRKSADEELKASGATVIEGVDLAKDDCGARIVQSLGDAKIDMVMVVAGIFITETWEEPKWDANRLMYQVCAVAPLIIANELVKAGNLGEGSRYAMITSEGGSIGLRTQEEGGLNYGHHMSKAAQNMCGKLLSFDMAPFGVSVLMLHPGFLKTPMTQHYSHLYEQYGAVTPDYAAEHILQAVERLNMGNTGRFVAPMGSAGLGLGAMALKEELPPFGELPW